MNNRDLATELIKLASELSRVKMFSTKDLDQAFDKAWESTHSKRRQEIKKKYEDRNKAKKWQATKDQHWTSGSWTVVEYNRDPMKGASSEHYWHTNDIEDLLEGLGLYEILPKGIKRSFDEYFEPIITKNGESLLEDARTGMFFWVRLNSKNLNKKQLESLIDLHSRQLDPREDFADREGWEDFEDNGGYEDYDGPDRAYTRG